MKVSGLRQQLDELDQKILKLVAQRQALVAEIGARKHEAGRPLRDYTREREVLEQAEYQAVELGMPAVIARDIMQQLIQHSLTHQEQRRWVSAEHGLGQSALIIGGLGRMGAWMAGYLDALGYSVEIADPGEGDSIFPHFADWQSSALDHDVIVVAAPMRISNQILLALAEKKPAALIFDIASLKSPLATGQAALIDAGCQVTSVHPMFGPDARMLADRHVLIVDVGNPEATGAALEMFAHTAAECVQMSPGEHDQAMSWVLGLSHLMNIAFATTLSGSGAAISWLQKLSSTTFNAQFQVANNIIHENPRLYYEIQHCNDSGESALELFASRLQELKQQIDGGDEEGFVDAIMAARRALDKKADDETR